MVWLLVVTIGVVFFIVLSCLSSFFILQLTLYLSDNSLTGSIPSEIALLTNLGESSVVWLLVVTIGVVFFIVLSCCVVIFHSTAGLYLYEQ